MTNWTAQNTANLSGLLKSTPLLNALAERRPKIEGKNFEQVSLEAKEMAGYERCMAEISTLAQAIEQPTASTPFVQGLEHFESRPVNTI